MTQHTFEGSGAPDFPPLAIGSHYFDADTQTTYTSVGTGIVADWVEDNPPVTTETVDAQMVHAVRESGAGTKNLPDLVGPNTNEHPTGFLGGIFQGDSTVTVTLNNPDSGADESGTLMTVANCASNASGVATINADGRGVVLGRVTATGASSTATVRQYPTSVSGFTNFSVDDSINDDSNLRDRGVANFSSGIFFNGGRLNAYTGSDACFSNFRSANSSKVNLYGVAIFAVGYLRAAASAIKSKIEGDGSGNLIVGTSRQTSGSSYSQVLGKGTGGLTIGYARSQDSISGIETSAASFGSIASGYSNTTFASTSAILASAKGCIAHGYVLDGDITASADNSFQFGVGDNTLADSLQVGNSGLRFKGTTGAPGTPQNGDFFMNSNYLYIRSNGSNVKIV